MASRWHKAVSSESLPPRSLLKVRIAGEAVLLARLDDGTAAASSPVCPHEAADLAEGSIYMGAIECPRHRYLYDLRTGENRYPKDVYPADLAAELNALRLFDVKEEQGWIWVRMDEE